MDMLTRALTLAYSFLPSSKVTLAIGTSFHLGKTTNVLLIKPYCVPHLSSQLLTPLLSLINANKYGYFILSLSNGEYVAGLPSIEMSSDLIIEI